MRILGLIGLVLALLVVGVLVKKQIGAAATPAVPALSASASDKAQPAATVRDQSSQVQRQYQQALDAAVQQRAMPDEAN